MTYSDHYLFDQKMDETRSAIAAMRRQEAKGYLKADGIYHQVVDYNNRGGGGETKNRLVVAAASGTCSSGNNNRPVDAECRKKMVAWSFRAVDSLKFDRETVSISISYLDRYLVTPSGAPARADRKVFQLAAMTSLYTAVKIHKTEILAPSVLSRLSQGVYSVKDIEEMEIRMLMALGWRVHPPTALGFVREYLKLIPENCLNSALRDVVYGIVKLHTEEVVQDHRLVSVRESAVAMYSLMSALEFVGMDQKRLGRVARFLSSPGDPNNGDDNYSSLAESKVRSRDQHRCRRGGPEGTCSSSKQPATAMPDQTPTGSPSSVVVVAEGSHHQQQRRQRRHAITKDEPPASETIVRD